MSDDQPRLFDDVPEFDGRTYSSEHDHARLARQLRKVAALMLDGSWRTLAEIAGAIDEPEASISARLRDLRKDRFGAYIVERQHRHEAERGCYEYRVSEGDSDGDQCETQGEPSGPQSGLSEVESRRRQGPECVSDRHAEAS